MSPRNQIRSGVTLEVEPLESRYALNGTLSPPNFLPMGPDLGPSHVASVERPYALPGPAFASPERPPEAYSPMPSPVERGRNVGERPEPRSEAVAYLTVIVVITERVVLSPVESEASLAKPAREATPIPTLTTVGDGRIARTDRAAPANAAVAAALSPFEAGTPGEISISRTSVSLTPPAADVSRTSFAPLSSRTDQSVLSVAMASLTSDSSTSDGARLFGNDRAASLPSAMAPISPVPPMGERLIEMNADAAAPAASEDSASRLPALAHLLIDGFAFAPGLVERALFAFQTVEGKLANGDGANWYWLGLSSWALAAALTCEVMRRPRSGGLSARYYAAGPFMVPEDGE